MAIDENPASPPADGGLSGLGLILQLGGTVFAALATLYGVIFLMEGSGWVTFFLVLCVARSLVHRMAGTELLYGRKGFNDPSVPRDQTQGVRRYVIVAAVHTAIICGLAIGKFDAPPKIMLFAAIALMLWPLILIIVLSQPRFRALRVNLPMPDDKGFEGASILMLIMGLMGTLGTGAALVLMLKGGGDQGIGMLLVLVLIALVIRSIMHAHAGYNGLGTRPYDRAVSLAKRYAQFGVIASIGTAAALFLMTMSLGGAFGGPMIMVMGALIWLLLAWPLIIRRFYGDREFADLLEGAAAPLQRRAPDGGLTSLGWFLVAQAAMAAAIMIVQIGAGGDGMSRSERGMFGMLGMFGSGSGIASIAALALQFWAGFELIAVSVRHRIAAQVFAVASVVIQGYQIFNNMPSMGHMRGPDAILVWFTLAIGIALTLVVPIVTFLLVNRKIRSRMDLGSVFS